MCKDRTSRLHSLKSHKLSVLKKIIEFVGHPLEKIFRKELPHLLADCQELLSSHDAHVRCQARLVSCDLRAMLASLHLPEVASIGNLRFPGLVFQTLLFIPHLYKVMPWDENLIRDLNQCLQEAALLPGAEFLAIVCACQLAWAYSRSEEASRVTVRQSCLKQAMTLAEIRAGHPSQYFYVQNILISHLASWSGVHCLRDFITLCQSVKRLDDQGHRVFSDLMCFGAGQDLGHIATCLPHSERAQSDKYRVMALAMLMSACDFGILFTGPLSLTAISFCAEAASKQVDEVSALTDIGPYLVEQYISSRLNFDGNLSPFPACFLDQLLLEDVRPPFHDCWNSWLPYIVRSVPCASLEVMILADLLDVEKKFGRDYANLSDGEPRRSKGRIVTTLSCFSAPDSDFCKVMREYFTAQDPSLSCQLIKQLCCVRHEGFPWVQLICLLIYLLLFEPCVASLTTNGPWLADLHSQGMNLIDEIFAEGPYDLEVVFEEFFSLDKFTAQFGLQLCRLFRTWGMMDQAALLSKQLMKMQWETEKGSLAVSCGFVSYRIWALLASPIEEYTRAIEAIVPASGFFCRSCGILSHTTIVRCISQSRHVIMCGSCFSQQIAQLPEAAVELLTQCTSDSQDAPEQQAFGDGALGAQDKSKCIVYTVNAWQKCDIARPSSSCSLLENICLVCKQPMHEQTQRVKCVTCDWRACLDCHIKHCAASSAHMILAGQFDVNALVGSCAAPLRAHTPELLHHETAVELLENVDRVATKVIIDFVAPAAEAGSYASINAQVMQWSHRMELENGTLVPLCEGNRCHCPKYFQHSTRVRLGLRKWQKSILAEVTQREVKQLAKSTLILYYFACSVDDTTGFKQSAYSGERCQQGHLEVIIWGICSSFGIKVLDRIVVSREDVQKFCTCCAKRGSGKEWVRLALHLGRLLLNPARSYLDNATHVCIVATGDADLAMIPFCALDFAGKPLVFQKDISYMPSLRALFRLSRPWQGLEAMKAPLLIADPSFGPGNLKKLKPLPGSLYEAVWLAGAMRKSKKDVNFLTGTDASLAAVCRALPSSDFVSVGAHAVVNKDLPLLSQICLAADESLTAERALALKPCSLQWISFLCCDSGGVLAGMRPQALNVFEAG